MSTLYYKTLGQGKPLILLHGLLGMADNLASLAKTLAENYWVILPDMINHGQSPHRASMDYPSMAGDVFTLMQHLAIDRTALLGHSMGGKIAMQCALAQPDSISQLIVADIAPVAYPAREHLLYFSAMQAVEHAVISRRQDADTVLHAQGIEALRMRQFLLKNLKRDEDGVWRWQCAVAYLQQNYEAICAAPDSELVYQGPSLFINGGASQYVQEKDEAIIKQYFPAVERVTLAGASHWLHAEYPEEFARHVLTFLAQNDEQSSIS